MSNVCSILLVVSSLEDSNTITNFIGKCGVDLNEIKVTDHGGTSRDFHLRLFAYAGPCLKLGPRSKLLLSFDAVEFEYPENASLTYESDDSDDRILIGKTS